MLIANKKNKTIEQVAEQIYFAQLMFCKIQNYKGDEKRLRFYENFYKILNSGSLPPKENIRKMSKIAKAYLNMRAKIDEQYIRAKLAKNSTSETKLTDHAQ